MSSDKKFALVLIGIVTFFITLGTVLTLGANINEVQKVNDECVNVNVIDKRIVGDDFAMTGVFCKVEVGNRG